MISMVTKPGPNTATELYRLPEGDVCIGALRDPEEKQHSDPQFRKPPLHRSWLKRLTPPNFINIIKPKIAFMMYYRNQTFRANQQLNSGYFV